MQIESSKTSSEDAFSESTYNFDKDRETASASFQKVLRDSKLTVDDLFGEDSVDIAFFIDCERANWELTLDIITNNKMGYEYVGPSKSLFEDPQNTKFLLPLHKESKVGFKFQADVPDLSKNCDKTSSARIFKQVWDPSRLDIQVVDVIEKYAAKDLSTGNISMEKLCKWLKELDYDPSKFFLSLFKNREIAKKRLAWKQKARSSII